MSPPVNNPDKPKIKYLPFLAQAILMKEGFLLKSCKKQLCRNKKIKKRCREIKHPLNHPELGVHPIEVHIVVRTLKFFIFSITKTVRVARIVVVHGVIHIETNHDGMVAISKEFIEKMRLGEDEVLLISE